MHARDIVDLFVEHHITDARQFQWLSQLRFHWLRDVDNIFIQHYSGNKLRIILWIAINFQLHFDSVSVCNSPNAFNHCYYFACFFLKCYIAL